MIATLKISESTTVIYYFISAQAAWFPVAGECTAWISRAALGEVHSLIGAIRTRSSNRPPAACTYLSMQSFDLQVRLLKVKPQLLSVTVYLSSPRSHTLLLNTS